MDYKEQAVRKQDTYAKSTETSPVVFGTDDAVFYTRDAAGYVRKHVYTAAGRTIDLVSDFPEEKKSEPVPEVKAPEKTEGVLTKALKKIKGK